MRLYTGRSLLQNTPQKGFKSLGSSSENHSKFNGNPAFIILDNQLWTKVSIRLKLWPDGDTKLKVMVWKKNIGYHVLRSMNIHNKFHGNLTRYQAPTVTQELEKRFFAHLLVHLLILYCIFSLDLRVNAMTNAHSDKEKKTNENKRDEEMQSCRERYR